MQRAVAAAAAAASLALLCAASLSGGARGGATALYERQLDMEIHDRSCPTSLLTNLRCSPPVGGSLTPVEVPLGTRTQGSTPLVGDITP